MKKLMLISLISLVGLTSHAFVACWTIKDGPLRLWNGETECWDFTPDEPFSAEHILDCWELPNEDEFVWNDAANGTVPTTKYARAWDKACQ